MFWCKARIPSLSPNSRNWKISVSRSLASPIKSRFVSSWLVKNCSIRKPGEFNYARNEKLDSIEIYRSFGHKQDRIAVSATVCDIVDTILILYLLEGSNYVGSATFDIREYSRARTISIRWINNTSLCSAPFHRLRMPSLNRAKAISSVICIVYLSLL